MAQITYAQAMALAQSDPIKLLALLASGTAPDGSTAGPQGGGGAGGTADFGTAVTGQSLEAGGAGNLGWLSSLRKAVTDRLGTLGQKAMAFSSPVVIASDQTAVPVSGTFWQATQPVSGTFWQATQPVSGTVTANAGTGTMAVSLSALPASTNTLEVVGDVAEDAALAGNPTRVGMRASSAVPTAMSADNDVVTPWADRNGAQIVRPRPAATATLANVTAAATSTTLLALNTGRLGAIVVNDSTASLYLKYGSTASATSYTYLLQPGALWEMPADILYTGIITGIWTAANGAARTTELS